MPQYIYKDVRTGERVDLTMTIQEMSRRQKNGGFVYEKDRVLERDYAAEHGGFKHKPGSWPMLSDACGVHTSQIGEARAEAIKRGVPTEFAKDGRAILTSQAHRKAYCESRGLYDRNGSFGDPQPRNV